MDLDELKKSWQHLGATNPRWAILSEPGREGGLHAASVATSDAASTSHHPRISPIAQ
ncbi:MAG: hypothetical protein NT107_11430 [Planctomycetota bacterium]|nr:hypothetical protein [Planctomycetota bacterium]